MLKSLNISNANPIFSALFLVCLFITIFLACTLASKSSAAEPATIAEAAERLDLVMLPLITGSELLNRREASLSYTVKDKPTAEVFDFVDKQLAERGWKQLPGARSFPDQGFASAEYAHGDFTIHISVTPHGNGQPGVTISHLGNVPIAELPTPDSAEEMHAFTSTVMYKSADGVEETAQACREKMLAAGWSPYGSVGDLAYYRKNGVLASVRTVSVPAQGGETVINYSTEMLSIELPVPSFGDSFSYTDSTTALGFDCDKTPQEVADFYREKLTPLGWKATTDKPIKVDWKLHTIFRNSSQEMITLSTHEFEGRTRVFLDHENAVEVAQEEYRMRVAAGEKAKYGNQPWRTIQVTIPAGPSPNQTEKWAVQFVAPKKSSFATAKKIAKTLTSSGWKSEGPMPKDPVLRSCRFEKESKIIWLMSIEPPKRDAWVAIIGIGGVEFQLASEGL